VDPLRSLLELSEQEKLARGLKHTPLEIWQQPDTWIKTYEHCRTQSGDVLSVLKQAGVRDSKTPPTVYILGAGTSDYSARALAPLLRHRWACDVFPVPSTTMLTDFEDFHHPGRDYLWISMSRSGDSPEGVALLERALERHPSIRHLLITCNPKGKMAQLSARHSSNTLAIILDDAVNDRGLAMTSSFTNMLLAGQCIAHADQIDRFERPVTQMAEAGRRFLPLAAQTAADVTSLGCTRACFVGAGVLRAIADESALKVVELSSGQVTTLAETPLGLRHGPMSSVDGNTIFVSYLSSERRRRGYELDLLREVDRKGLGKVRIAVTAQSGSDASELADHVLSLGCPDDFPDYHRPVLDVIFGQLLGLFASMRCGLKPDQPSPSGTINRVVQPIQLYS